MGEPNLRRMTADEFFAWQAKQEKLYELIDGIPVVLAKRLAGVSRAHDRIIVNIIASLATQLRGGPCRPTTDNLAVRVSARNIRRPDVTVECGQELNDLEVREPRAVIEVLSPNTMRFDRFRKVLEYQNAEALAHIVLVDTEAPRAAIISRHADGGWLPVRHDGFEAVIELTVVGARLNLSDVFEGVEFSEPRGARPI
jgi:Uma2 family endonuclease